MNEKIMNIGFCGDVMIGRLVNDALDGMEPHEIWGDMLKVMHSTDLNIINLEAALTKSRRKVFKVFNFKCDPHKVQVLKEARVEIANLANNHILDYSDEGLVETMKVLDQAEILHVGAGLNLEDARKPVIIERKGIRIGVLGFTDNEPTWKGGASRLGTNYVPINACGLEEAVIEVAKLREQVDLVVVTMHWGPNMRERPRPYFIDFAHGLLDHGVDIFHGHSAHIFQGIEVYDGKLIMYDTGDFVDDYAVDPILRNDRSFFFVVTVGKDGFKEVSLHPTLITFCKVNRAPIEDAAASIERMRLLSKEFGTININFSNE